MTPIARSEPSDAGPPPATAPAPARWHRAAEAAILFALLVAFWIVLSGRFTALTLALGTVSAAIATALTGDRFFWVGGQEREFGMPLRSLALTKLAVYPFRLLLAIARANLQVARLVLHPRLPIHPAFVQFRTGLVRPLSQVVLANLITVTPGTVTVDLEDGRYLVHALEPRLAADLLSGALPNAVAEMLGETAAPPPEIIAWTHSVRDVAP